MIEKAIEMALKAHTGQKDLDGKPVILHPLAVGLAGKNDIQITVGILHDVVEDSNFTFEDLCKCGFSEEVIDSLKLLTHKKRCAIRRICKKHFLKRERKRYQRKVERSEAQPEKRQGGRPREAGYETYEGTCYS